MQDVKTRVGDYTRGISGIGILLIDADLVTSPRNQKSLAGSRLIVTDPTDQLDLLFGGRETAPRESTVVCVFFCRLCNLTFCCVSPRGTRRRLPDVGDSTTGRRPGVGLPV